MRWLLLLAVLWPVTALAGPAEELSGLFLQACLPFAGRPAALRQWAAAEQLPAVPDPARTVFLHHTPGQVFDASNVAGKFALLSSDDGTCAVVTNLAGDADTVRALQQALTDARIGLRQVSERNDPINPQLHYREYLAVSSRPGGWRILVSTVNGGAPGQAMLTAAPQ